MASLYKEKLFEDLLYEDEGLTAERTRIKALLQAYREAFTVSLLVSCCRMSTDESSRDLADFVGSALIYVPLLFCGPCACCWH